MESCEGCDSTKKMLEKAAQDNVETAYDRMSKMKPCPIGKAGACCKNCNMGPCRLSIKNKDSGVGICGATASTIAARNFARMVAAGVSAHSDHGREVLKTFIEAAKQELPGYDIKDETKLHAVAADFDVSIADKDKYQIALELGEKMWKEFTRQDGEGFVTLAKKRAPKKRQEIWEKLDIFPRSVDLEVVETMHRTCMGNDQDYKNIILGAMRAALANGWGGSMLGTELQDIMFGKPNPLPAKINLGAISKDEVNVIVHGHEPVVAEMILLAARDPELLEYAKSKGAKGINIAGLCCTANEMLQRHGIPIAGNFSQQELAVITGAVELMAVDVQCIMQSLTELAKHYHTHIVTTSRKAKIQGALHMEMDEKKPLESAKGIIRKAIDNFKNRGSVSIPSEPVDLIAGFNHETINYMLGGSYRSSYKPLNDNIVNGRIAGIAAIVGCDTPSGPESEKIHVEIVKELIANNVLVLQTGCTAQIVAKAGLMTPEAAKYAGAGLAEVCETVGMPPVLHCGSCMDDSRLLVAGSAMVKEGGLGDDISDLPVVGVCVDWMSEKAIAIGMYCIASGVYTVFGPSLPVTSSDVFSEYMLDTMKDDVKACWGVGKDAKEITKLVLDKITEKREALGISKKKERVLYDMEMRRKIELK